MRLMERKLTRRLLVASGAALAIAPSAFAHRSQTVLTLVNWNPATSKLEVIHRMHAHDAEVGISQSTGATAAPELDITQPKNQAKWMLYVEKHFSMKGPAGQIALEPVGAELEADAIVLYQEARLPAAPKELTIDNQILRDVFEQQANLVNVKLAEKTRTLLFSGKDGAKQAKDLL
jgi:uncharacterized protein DUF6702